MSGKRFAWILLGILGALLVAGWLLSDWRIVGGAALALVGFAWLWLRRWRARRRRRRRRPSPREHIPNALRQMIYQRDGYACRYCGRQRSRTVRLELDHFVPVARGGTDVPENLVTSCHECNRAKAARLLLDEAALRRFIAEREAAVAALARADRWRAIRREVLVTLLILVVILAAYLALARSVL